MFSIKTIPYKTKLITIYISTTLLGIILILAAIYNASREQLLLDHITNMHQTFSDRLLQHSPQPNFYDQLAEKLSSEHYRVSPLKQLDVEPLIAFGCTINLDSNTLLEDRLSKYGGMSEVDNCLISWVILKVENSEDSLMVLHKFDSQQIDSIMDAYSNRLIIPLVFFAWLTVWGSLMLGNLVNHLQKQKEEVEHIALHDTLTGLPNRKYFSERITEIISFSKRLNAPFIMAMVDLNKFKSVNDELGHHYGDLLLKQVAQRFKDGIREYDMIARHGGDEFILLLMGTDTDSSIKVLERIYQSLIKDYTLLDNTVNIGASIGVSYFPEHDTSYSELMHKADMAMYLAKESAGGIRVYNSSMQAKSA